MFYLEAPHHCLLHVVLRRLWNEPLKNSSTQAAPSDTTKTGPRGNPRPARMFVYSEMPLAQATPGPMPFPSLSKHRLQPQRQHCAVKAAVPRWKRPAQEPRVTRRVDAPGR